MRRIVAGNKMFSVERDCETKPLLLHITIHKLYLLDWGVTRGGGTFFKVGGTSAGKKNCGYFL